MTAEQVERCVIAIEAIADALQRIAPEATEAPVVLVEPLECEHPQESRVDFGVTDGAPDWLCLTCGFRTAQERTT